VALPAITAVDEPALTSVDSNRWDAVVVVTPTIELGELEAVHRRLHEAARFDARVGKDVMLLVAPEIAGGRLVVAPTGPLGRDYDDVRRFADASRAGVVRARDAGARRILLLVPRAPLQHIYERAVEVAVLGALAALWEPLEAREARSENDVEPVVEIGFQNPPGTDGAALADLLTAMETGRRLARDITGTNPERMSPSAVAQACVDAFAGTRVRVEVIDEPSRLAREYPLIAAVARASMGVGRHRPCVIRLEYQGDGDVRETVLLAGKGVVYDTGGSDLKTGGGMAGMSRDKGGAGAVAGFVKTIAQMQPEGLRVVALIGAVRNSIGADAYVADEIVESHAGVRVRVGNTDAEGRMVLADLLSHLRCEAIRSVEPRILSVATLTGHAARMVGPYSVALDNGPARIHRIASGLAAMGEIWGDPFEISRVRREDFDFVRPRSKADDVLQCNNAASAVTTRGHQFPAAFLAIASGLDKHGADAERPIPFTHIDIAGSAVDNGDWQHGRPTAAPVVALAARWLIG
jgi:leucyl aminopeptidase